MSTKADPIPIIGIRPISAVLVLNYLAVSKANVESYIVGDARMTCTARGQL